MRKKLIKHLFVRLLIGAAPMVFFAIGMFAKGESGNNGMSLNLEKFLPVCLILIYVSFLIINGLNHFVKGRVGYGLCSISTVVILVVVFLYIMYLEHLV
ncbi:MULTISPECIES: hypothetical protein [Sphingobacterium]|jgi:hypothetical protein|uniref:hypothetical protein n=1 Tax=Sphingobacterium TaxID=28453 RepID=UPI00038A0E4B|nr:MULTISPECIES: hypothetical protein [unclassified Sphingobacterium]KKX47788.1 hypothetical protein L950_0224645 [Sphingobacterium sp. IITKGP-BTPF85]NJI72673.1 hypothetical protein [Sphingobacterium sp. B16(2022)]